jgi:plastocyanin
MRLALLTTTGITAIALAGAGTATAAPIALVGSAGPGFRITLTNGGKALKTVKPGAYTLTVRDKSAIHNFHIFGPGLNKVVTTIPFVGKKTVSFTLKKGTYTFQCDAHAAEGMKGSFKVT